MLVVTAFHPGDADQALRLATWSRDLGGCKGHDLLLVKDTTCDPAIAEQIHSLFSDCFDTVETLEFVDHFKSWPHSPNAIFSMVARHIRQNPRPWLFCEPDCVPLKAGWLDLLEAEYQAAGKPFLGDFVSVHTPELDVPDHMSGNAIYPGDMMKHAGVALIANDIAWDVLAAGEILPQMHRSKLIHHSWKHGAFADWGQFEREVLAFKPECCLFHADKSGSIYPLLRARQNLSGGDSSHISDQGRDEPKNKALESSPPQTSSIFIKSYAQDFPFLHYCLRSIERFTCGFRRVIILSSDPGVPNPDRSSFEEVITPETAGEDGYLRQQARKLYADTLTDADFILFTDSDTIFTRHVTPETYFTGGLVNWMITPYAKTETPWKPMIEKFLGRPVEFETMRRHPQLVPRWLLIAMRDFCEKQHGMTLDKYVMSQPYREFSEFNALGAFAYYFHNDKFNWINTEEVPAEQWPPLTVLQKYSHGGLTPEIEAEFEKILSESNGAPVTPSTTDMTGRIANNKTLLFDLSGLTVTPWENKEQSLEEIRSLAERLKNFCGKASHVRAVRLELHTMGVIELPYRFKRRKGKWRSKKK